MSTLTINDITISQTCEDTDPCLHLVLVPKLNINCEMDGRSIYLLFVENNLEVPKHFQSYSGPDYDDDFV